MNPAINHWAPHFDTFLHVFDRLAVKRWVYISPSYSHYYLLSPSTLFFLFCTSYCFFAHLVVFFAHLFCTSYCLLHIVLSFAHLIVLHFFYFIAHFTLISPFLTICMPLCYVTLYNLYSYYFALSTERTWFDYISLLIIPCITIMWQIKKPWTLLCSVSERIRSNLPEEAHVLCHAFKNKNTSNQLK